MSDDIQIDQLAEAIKANQPDLRDRIAMAALTGYNSLDSSISAEFTPEKKARWSYEDADAMLEARK